MLVATAMSQMQRQGQMLQALKGQPLLRLWATLPASKALRRQLLRPSQGEAQVLLQLQALEVLKLKLVLQKLRWVSLKHNEVSCHTDECETNVSQGETNVSQAKKPGCLEALP